MPEAQTTKSVFTGVIFVEPPLAWATRTDDRARQCLNLLDSPLRFEGVWDHAIVDVLQKGSAPMQIMAVVNMLRKRQAHRNKREGESIKREILLRVCALIRQGDLVRVRRTFVTIPRATVTQSPA